MALPRSGISQAQNPEKAVEMLGLAGEQGTQVERNPAVEVTPTSGVIAHDAFLHCDMPSLDPGH